MTVAIPTLHFGDFTIERIYAHTPDRVFAAFAAFEDTEACYRWFVSGEGWKIDVWHLEIVKGARIVDAYSMSLDGKPFSHSLAVIELFPERAHGCRLVYTEQGAYHGGEDDVKNRKAGCEELFGKLAMELPAHA